MTTKINIHKSYLRQKIASRARLADRMFLVKDKGQATRPCTTSNILTFHPTLIIGTRIKQHLIKRKTWIFAS